jgi:hypothetical protein
MDPESRAVGYAENAFLPLGAITTFRGVAVDDTAVLIAFTRNGDANLDGVVDDDDVTVVGATFAPGVANANWAAGDFDYNGFVDDDDVTVVGALFDRSIDAVGAPLASPTAATLSEVEYRPANRSSDDLTALAARSITSKANFGDGLRHSHRRVDNRSPAVDQVWANWR